MKKLIMFMLIITGLTFSQVNNQPSIAFNTITFDSDALFGFDVSYAINPNNTKLYFGMSYGSSFYRSGYEYINEEYEDSEVLSDLGLLFGIKYIQANPSIIFGNYKYDYNEWDADSGLLIKENLKIIYIGFGVGLKVNIPLTNKVMFTIIPKMNWIWRTEYTRNGITKYTNDTHNINVFKLSSGLTFNF